MKIKENQRKSMKDQRRSKKIDENQSQSMKNQRKSIEIKENCCSWCSWLLLARPGCSWLLLTAPGCSWLLLAAPGCSWLLLAPPGCSWLLLAAPDYSWLPLAARTCRVSHNKSYETCTCGGSPKPQCDPKVILPRPSRLSVLSVRPARPWNRPGVVLSINWVDWLSAQI